MFVYCQNGYAISPRCLGIYMALLTLITSFGCQKPAVSGDDSKVFTDDLGRTVQITSIPRRIVSLAPNITELLFAAGAGEQIVGVSTADDYPAEVNDLPHFSAYPLNLESLAALQPDLVVAAENVNSLQNLDALDRLGIPVFVLSFDHLTDVWDALARLGTLTGNEEAGSIAQKGLVSRLSALRTTDHSQRDRPSVLVLLGTQTLYAFGGNSYMSEAIEFAGGKSATASYPGPSVILTEEFILESDPEYIVGAFAEAATMNELLDNHPSWTVLSAVRNHRLCTVDPDLLLRPSPRLVDGIESIAACLNRTTTAGPTGS
jgi:iron complex transport system substrate-binding protein